MNGILPIENIINVTIQGTPQGLSPVNVNRVALFTTESPGNVDPFREYLSASQVAEDYGTNSVTYDMAVAVFSQTPNILSGNGTLVIIPLELAVSATVGNFTSADISANLASLTAVTDGDLRVVLNGTNIDLTGINLSNASTLAQVASILNNLLTDATVEAVGNTLKFTSRKVGSSSTVTLTSVPAGTGTDISGVGYINQSAGTSTGGANASGETLSEALVRTEDSVAYVGIMTNLEMEDSVIEAFADVVQSRDKIFVHHFASTEDIAGVATSIKDQSNTKTRCVGFFQSPAEANLMKSAYVGRAFSMNVSGSQTAQTMNLKTLATINYDTTINQTIRNNALTAGMDLYTNYGGSPSVVSSGGNLFFDQVYNRIALKFALQVEGFNYLKQTNTKVPQTEPGMDGLKASYNVAIERFIANGYIAPGTWNTSETFGNPDDLKRNVAEKGYYTYSQPIAQQAQSERELRDAPLVQIAVKEAGAIHRSTVIVTVNP